MPLGGCYITPGSGGQGTPDHINTYATLRFILAWFKCVTRPMFFTFILILRLKWE